jgi:hypothetical protein
VVEGQTCGWAVVSPETASSSQVEAALRFRLPFREPEREAPPAVSLAPRGADGSGPGKAATEVRRRLVASAETPGAPQGASVRALQQPLRR